MVWICFQAVCCWSESGFNAIGLDLRESTIDLGFRYLVGIYLWALLLVWICFLEFANSAIGLDPVFLGI